MIKNFSSNIYRKTLNGLSKSGKIARQGLIELYHHPIKHPISGAKVVGRITKKGLTNLYNHPIKHPINTTKTFVNDYWDVGTSLVTEWGISKGGLAIIQKYNPYVRLTNAVITAIPVIGSKERGLRNICLQTASWAFLIGRPIGKISGGVLAVTGICLDLKRRKQKKDNEQKPILNSHSLEEKV